MKKISSGFLALEIFSRTINTFKNRTGIAANSALVRNHNMSYAFNKLLGNSGSAFTKKSHKIVALMLLLVLCGLLFNEAYRVNFVHGNDALASDSLVNGNADWQPQDYPDSQGIYNVTYEDGILKLQAHLVGGHINFEKGEVWLDLRYYPGLEGQTPIDLTLKTITVHVEVPEDFVGEPSIPNGLQVFVKQNDSKWTPQYGDWVNIQHGGEYEATLTPIMGPGFDPQKIIIIGVKFAIGHGSLDTYDGPLYITNVMVDPPFELTPPPPLPQETPPPVVAAGDSITVRCDGLYLNNEKWFVVGGNFRGLPYGQSFGVTDWFAWGNGVSRHPNFVRVNFDYFRRAGIKVIRAELLADGRTMFDNECHVTGYNDMFREDIRTFLNLADQAGIKVEFTLLDFLIAGKIENVEGVWLRGRSGIITNEMLKMEFIDEFLVPFLIEFGDHPALIGFDVINEPEWIISQAEGGDWENVDDPTKAEDPVPIELLESFIDDCLNTIRTYAPGKLTTVGVSIKFIALVDDFDLDYLALHHYSSMGPLSYYVPLIPAGKPWILEEYPTRNTDMSITEYLSFIFEAGGAGALLWNLSPEIDDFTFTHDERDAVLLELYNWVIQIPPPITLIGLTVVSGGTRYTTPAVLLIDGGGTGATATAHVSNGVIYGIVLTNPGRGYTSPPTVVIIDPCPRAEGAAAIVNYHTP